MNTGIYTITHVGTGRKYVGSATNFSTRWRIHKTHLRLGSHHSKHLQSAWNMYGENAFTFEKAVVCEIKDLLIYEQILIDHYKAYRSECGFNCRPTAGSMLGHRHSLETRQRLREIQTGRKYPEATKAKLSAMRMGRKMPEWFGASVSERMTGFKHSDEAKKKMSASKAGKKQSGEHIAKRAKLSEEAVSDIRLQLFAGATQKSLSEKFNVNQSTISLIKSGRRWPTTLSTTGEMK